MYIRKPKKLENNSASWCGLVADLSRVGGWVHGCKVADAGLGGLVCIVCVAYHLMWVVCCRGWMICEGGWTWCGWSGDLVWGADTIVLHRLGLWK